jgi:hypothetical protein
MQTPSVDVENQNIRIIALSSTNDCIVGSSLSGYELFCIAKPVEMEAGIVLAAVAKALHTDSFRLKMFEKSRCLGSLDIVQDVNSITVKQAMTQADMNLKESASIVQVMTPVNTLLYCVAAQSKSSADQSVMTLSQSTPTLSAPYSPASSVQSSGDKAATSAQPVLPTLIAQPSHQPSTDVVVAEVLHEDPVAQI